MEPTVNTIHSFAHAQNVRLDTYNQNNTNVYHVNSSSSYRPPLDRLLANIAPGAFHDADEACDLPKCHPETRAAVQENILSWIEHGDAQPKKLMWITGPAGSGKTAIASTVAEICQERGFLAASFFFSGYASSPYRRLKRRLITTLAYQLMQHERLVGLKDAVLRRIEHDPVVFQKRLKEQVEVLVLGPLRSLRLPRSNLPKVVIIDGLDECEADSDIRDGRPSTDVSGWRSKEQVHREILSALLQALDDPSFPFRIIVVSRPERAIKHFFELDERVASNTLGIFLDGSYRPDTDIALFLRAKFAALGLRYGIPQDWFNDEDIRILVEQASGQFIYPATIVRFITETGDPVRQLQLILRWRARVSESNPFATLDALYTRILQSSPDKVLAVKWIQAFRLLQQETPAIRSDESTLFIRSFLEVRQGQMATILGPLTSLMSLEGTESRMGFHLYHKTLVDFLVDPNRCGNLYVTEVAQYRFLRGRWYAIMKAQGFQVPVKDRRLQARFLDLYAQMPRTWPMVRFMDLHQPYNSVDVKWWLDCLGPVSTEHCVSHMLRFVHTQCPWYRCIPSCKVWRDGIIEYYLKQTGRPVPGKVVRFLDKFVKKI
ncbi:hypothetical protein FA13DRAFT_1739534 [Coprinellus micaceus]|uniref:Nephrocystin 3-like N-terminal domain-containing protein n=1 Tax=Coprinellus micaceus TaxID=71717 RepID=A0A4Y7SQP5_COPMI|nr:hypothetical protein FA13DRAFT_1739534 [Coprinellus micaceus]